MNPYEDGYWDNLSIFSKLSIGILSLSPNGDVMECNEAAAEAIGFAPEALRQLTIDKIFPLLEPDSWQLFWRDLQNRDHLESLGGLVDIQHQNIPARIIWFSCRVKSKHLCFVLIFKIVDHLPVQSDISIYKHLLIQLLNTNEYSTMTLDENNHVCSLNDESCRLLKVNRSDIQGNNVVDFLPKALTNRFLKKKQQALESMSPSIFSHSGAGFGFSSMMVNEIALLPFVDSITSSKNIIAIILHAGDPMGSPMIQRPDQSMLALLPSMPFAIDLQSFLNSFPAVFFITDAQSCLLWANTLFCELLDANQAELIRKSLSEVICRPDVAEKYRKEDMYIVRTRQSLFEIVEYDTYYRGSRSRTLKFPLFDEHGVMQAIIGMSIRIEEQNGSAEVGAVDSDNLLKSISPMLSDIKKSIDILLDQGAQNSKLRPQSQTNDIRDLVLPYIESLNKTILKKDQKQYLGLIEENINRLSDPITAKISSPVFRLSPNQVKVAQLIRDGKTNKEIAELLHLSKSTILTHRHNIRVKLNLKKKKINLRSYLLSLA